MSSLMNNFSIYVNWALTVEKIRLSKYVAVKSFQLALKSEITDTLMVVD